MLLQDLLGLSEQQIQDILLLRRLYLTKRGHLAARRDAVTDELAASKTSLPNPDSLAKLSKLSADLQQIAAEDYEAHIRICCAFRRGVSLCWSCTMCIIMQIREPTSVLSVALICQAVFLQTVYN